MSEAADRASVAQSTHAYLGLGLQGSDEEVRAKQEQDRKRDCDYSMGRDLYRSRLQ